MSIRIVMAGLIVAGIAVFVALLLSNGVGAIFSGVAMVGWGLALLVAIRLVALSLAGLAWGVILSGEVQRSPWLYIGLRLIRESINALLPVAQVGGDMIGGRWLARSGVAPGLAGASIMVDLLLQAATQGVFALIGLGALWWAFGDVPAIHDIGGVLIAAVPALGGFFLAQRLGLFALVDRGLASAGRIFPSLATAGRIDLQPSLCRLYAGHRRIALAAAIHFVAWTTGIIEIWIGLSGMRVQPSWSECLVIESLGQAVRSAAFTVPGALGVQEGGFLLLGSLFGLSASISLALSIAKRLPDFVIGLPGLAVWQWLETVSLLSRPTGVMALPEVSQTRNIALSFISTLRCRIPLRFR